MDITTVLASAVKVRATDARVTVGEQTLMTIHGEIRTLFCSKVKSQAFNDGIAKRLDAFKREELRTTGRCECEFHEPGLGNVRAVIEPTNALFVMPPTFDAPAARPPAQTAAPGQMPRSLFSRIFGR